VGVQMVALAREILAAQVVEEGERFVVQAERDDEGRLHFSALALQLACALASQTEVVLSPRFLPVLLLAIALPVSAQNAPLPRLSGTLSQTVSGQTVKANLFWQAPDSLKIEILNPKNEVAQTILTSGNSTLSFDTATKRLTVLDANIAREWFRGWNIAFGGPANFAFMGASTSFRATRDQGITLVRDKTLLGQDEERAFYIAWKRRVRAFPARSFIIKDGRVEYEDSAVPVPLINSTTTRLSGGNRLMRAQISFDAQHIPTRAEVEAQGQKVSFVYDLKVQAGDFPEGTFALPDAAKDAIKEAQNLGAPSSYKGETADDLCNRGAALWNASGDAAGAFSLWARASALNPKATAPKLWAFDVALSTRQPNVAARALDTLKGDLSEADFATLHARLDALQGDNAAYIHDLRASLGTSGDPARTLALSLALKARGDLKGARGLWNSLLLAGVPRDVQALAAENLTLASTRDELSSVGTALSGDADAVRLARALLDLRDGKTSDTTFTEPEFEATLARALERGGDDDDARRVWQTVEAGGNVGEVADARAHLVVLAARAGDASGALSLWKEEAVALEDQSSRDAAQNALFDAFQKAGKADALRAAILNRATAMGARDEDLRLELAYQEAFGDDAQVGRAVDAGFDRFENVPFWEGKKAERLVESAFSESRNRNGKLKQALGLLDSAIKTAPEPSFWVQQRALLLIQRATKTSAIAFADESKANEDAARDALTTLENTPDPDFQTVAALGWDAFPTNDDKAHAVADANRALDSAPFDGERATLIFANRQILTRILAPEAAAIQWRALFDITRSAGDEAGLVASLLNQQDRGKDSAGMAQLLVHVAGERWPLDDYGFLLNGAAGRIVGSPRLGEVVSTLQAQTDSNTESGRGYLLARAALSAARLAHANAVIAQPGAPPAADAELLRATRGQVASFAALMPLANGDVPFWSSRARSLLLDNPSLPTDAKRALLEKSVASEPGEPSIALALANAQDNVKAREKVATTLEFSPETWRRLALDALAGNDAPGANFWSNEAFNYAAHSPNVSAVEFQRIAFARAKIAWQTGSPSLATALYTGLSGLGWANTDRAAALLALRRRLAESGKNDEALALDAQIKALGLDKDEAQNAIGFLDDVEN